MSAPRLSDAELEEMERNFRAGTLIERGRFVVLAYAAIPRLLAEVRRLREENEQAKESCVYSKKRADYHAHQEYLAATKCHALRRVAEAARTLNEAAERAMGVTAEDLDRGDGGRMDALFRASEVMDEALAALDAQDPK